jgi:hypothetical protein
LAGVNPSGASLATVQVRGAGLAGVDSSGACLAAVEDGRAGLADVNASDASFPALGAESARLSSVDTTSAGSGRCGLWSGQRGGSQEEGCQQEHVATLDGILHFQPPSVDNNIVPIHSN